VNGIIERLSQIEASAVANVSSEHTDCEAITVQVMKSHYAKEIKSYITLIRPKHWLKNILIFVPLLYAGNLIKLKAFLSSVRCFVAFCLITSAVYVVNDVVDVGRDRQHPFKSKRPIASGQIEINQAIVLAVFLLISGFSLAIVGYNNYFVALFAALYVLMNLLYSFMLKHYAIVDCFCIAAGFVLRIYAGGAVNNDRISEWLFLTMISASLFMAFGKRRGEMMYVADTVTTRKVLASYNLGFLNGMLFVFAGLSAVFYALWAMSNVSTMIYTVPLVIFIICKYLLIVHGETSHGEPTSIILGDRGLMIAICILGLLTVMLLYVR